MFFFTWPLIVATTYDQDNKLNPKKKNWIIFQTETGAVYICYLPAGRSVLGKTVPEVLSKYGRAVLKTESCLNLRHKYIGELVQL